MTQLWLDWLPGTGCQGHAESNLTLKDLTLKKCRATEHCRATEKNRVGQQYFGTHLQNLSLTFLKLKKLNLPSRLPVHFYSCTVESILTYCITVWYDSCTSLDWKALKRVIKIQYIIGIKLLAIEDLNNMHCQELQSVLPHVFWKVL